MSKGIALTTLVLFLSVLTSQSQNPDKITVAAYYFPNYHTGDARNIRNKGNDWSEWELVKAAKPRFPGHDQPKVPLWGYTDEKDPMVMAQKIKTASEFGIDCFIFDWYMYEDGPFLNRCLDEGFLKAKNVGDIRFALMWANHDWVDIHPYTRGAKQKLLYEGKVSPKRFDEICDILVSQYFTQPNYWKIDGKAYFSVYDIQKFMEGFGSIEDTKTAMTRLNEKAVSAGLKGVHWNLVAWGRPILPVEKVPANYPELIRMLGFNSATSYVWVHHVDLRDRQTDFNLARDQYFHYWEKAKKEFNVPYYPNVSMGWDPSPRCEPKSAWGNFGYPFTNIISNNTPGNFKTALQMAKDKLQADPHGPKILNINCWNEWTEGSYLEPDNKNKFEYLEAVKSVFNFIGCSSENNEEKDPFIYTNTQFKKLFADPPSEYRSAPLWDWNEQISKEGIDFQMKEFKKAGIGGVFVHPRPGLLTEYLSEDWFQLFDFTVQKGKELGIKVWIYDENSYPSGFAGGHVPAEMPDSYKHGTGLSMEIQQQLNLIVSDTVAVVLKKTDAGFENITPTLEKEKGQQGMYYIFRKTYPAKSSWYGGFTYVDLLYKGVTEKFMELTMTKGYEKSKADFGKTLKGIFTDEPNLEAAMSMGSLLRWTPDLWDAFQKRWGYDLKVNLPSLVEETGNWKKVRHDYYELILELFVDRWAKPWSKYCDENQLKWTGHYWEHGWPEPTDGSDESAFYIWHQQPGIDMLGNRLDSAGFGDQFGNDRAVRELHSVANQAGRTRTLSETYGGGGWEMNFETQKRLVDWECVIGVNFVNQHLSYYSLNGVRKFDYPPSFSYHEPWWNHYKLMGDYIGRISMAMASGQQINQTLLLQPNTTAWMYFARKNKNPAILKIRDGFKNFVYRMEQQHIEYDVGSENVLKELGKVKGKTLQVGQRDYSLVVIPAEMENIEQNTLELLQKYMDNGGKVLSFIRNVSMVNAAESSKVTELATKYADQWTFAENLTDDVALKLLRHDDFTMIDHTTSGMLYHQRRIVADGQILFVVNSHQTKSTSSEVSLAGNYVTKLDLVTGKAYSYPAKAEKGKVTFQIDLGPVGSAMFTISDQKSDDPKQLMVSGTETAIKSNGEVAVKRESDNIMMVNYLDLKTAKSDKKDIYFMNALIGLLNENGVEMGNPWQHKIQYKKNYLALDSMFKADSWFEASYHFQINPNLEAEAMKSIRAVVERPELWTVSINGKEISKIPGTYWIDKSFSEFAVGEYLKPGKNTLTLKAPRMHVLAEVMPVYFIGDFLVKPAKSGFEIANGNISALGSWRESGLPFYSQKVAYTQSYTLANVAGTAFKVKLNRWNGSVAEVLVNGQTAGLIAWQPNELDVTSYLKDGSNEITIKVTGSLKNTFGFFYRKNEGSIFGPQSWNYAPEKAPDTSGYFLMDYGMIEPFDLVQVK